MRRQLPTWLFQLLFFSLKKIIPASPSQCLVPPDYLWSNLYVCSVLYVCVYVVSLRKTATPISNLKTNVLYLFILHLQSSGHVVTGYNSKLDSSFLRRAPACIIILSNCMSASGFGRTDCGWGMSTHGETTPNLTLWGFLSSIFKNSLSFSNTMFSIIWLTLKQPVHTRMFCLICLCVYVVSFRIKGYANLKFKNQCSVFVHSSPTVESTSSYWL